ncbi:hypothetical protein DAPPUDRAFT_253753 [Daphnia pulex]|uniref:Uncharacterized protein n=1 Tax=Daphnia pulex TaxID=6669 RepID=E9H5U2_DAPPU|nr:hypothetical protein DAPPUDRAFT_253753 [Daphnia pulex]|eukprot:EFX72927.1 hypothetical protein DAPPUDRAFT_253753 [Daphnia pulex]
MSSIRGSTTNYAKIPTVSEKIVVGVGWPVPSQAEQHETPESNLIRNCLHKIPGHFLALGPTRYQTIFKRHVHSRYFDERKNVKSYSRS